MKLKSVQIDMKNIFNQSSPISVIMVVMTNIYDTSEIDVL